MHPDSVRFALGGFVVSLCEATELATGRPIGQLVGYLMERMASNAEPEAAELCTFLADCADPQKEQIALARSRQGRTLAQNG
jgi:hypothetical protein